MEGQAKVIGINGNVVSIRFEDQIVQNEVVYVHTGDSRLKSEVIRIEGNRADLQVFESTYGIKVGDEVELTGDMLSAELGPGLLGMLYDGLQNPLHLLAEEYGFFLERGKYILALSRETTWDFTPSVAPGDRVKGGSVIGSVPEGQFRHKIMVPFNFRESYEVVRIVKRGSYTIDETIAVIKNKKEKEFELRMSFKWPVKLAVKNYPERLSPSEPLATKIRIVDTLFPIARGGCYCTPGPFGAGKTVLQQITSRNAAVDIVIIAACGERANEVVETIQEFPKLTDPNTGRYLMERTIIVCNTSSMPVAARESSVYTAVTMAEYYRQMGLHVLLLADSTSRWAQAMRERSGRLEEIPGEEAFPAYLESVVAGFYERAGRVRLYDGSEGSVTIGGTVSPAGGNFEEPVTQATLKVVGAFHGLSQDRADARKYPAIDPMESWSRYEGIIPERIRKELVHLIARASEVDQMMKVVGEEGITQEDYILYLKSELFDAVYLQQNAFDPVDAATGSKRQDYTLTLIRAILVAHFDLKNKEEARSFFHQVRQSFLDLNGLEFDSKEYSFSEDEILTLLEKKAVKDKENQFGRMRQVFLESDMDSHFRKSNRYRGFTQDYMTDTEDAGYEENS